MLEMTQHANGQGGELVTERGFNGAIKKRVIVNGRSAILTEALWALVQRMKPQPPTRQGAHPAYVEYAVARRNAAAVLGQIIALRWAVAMLLCRLEAHRVERYEYALGSLLATQVLMLQQ